MSELFDLSGQVAVVTGGCGFLGAGFCRALALAGARVVAVDLLAPAATGARAGGNYRFIALPIFSKCNRLPKKIQPD